MGKITFRADEGLIARLEEYDESKSEVMRRALREYLDDHAVDTSRQPGSVDDRIADRVDDIIDSRLEERLEERLGRRLDGAPGERLDGAPGGRLDGSHDERIDGPLGERPVTDTPRDVNVSITLEGDALSAHQSGREPRRSADRRPDIEVEGDADADGEADAESGERTCKQCGELLAPAAVYCQNCGEKSSQRVFCECGDEIRSDWAFCPTCGRRTPAADVLDSP